MKTTFEHEIDLPNGQVAKRSSESRRYSHGVQVIATKPDGTLVNYIESWSSTPALAMKAADSIRARNARWSATDYGRTHWGTLVSVQAVPVTRFREHVTAGKTMAPATLAKRRLNRSIDWLVRNVQDYAKPVDPTHRAATWDLGWLKDQVRGIIQDARKAGLVID